MLIAIVCLGILPLNSTHRKTNRWPLALSYNILDVAALATYFIYKANNEMIKNDARSTFLRQLGEELYLPIIQDRSQNMQIMRHFATRLGIECMLQKPVNVIDKTTLPSTSTNAVRDSTERKKVIGACYIAYIVAAKKFENAEKLEKLVLTAINRFVTNIVKI